MGWIETPAPPRAVCVMSSCGHAEAVAVFVARRNPTAPRPLCVEHVIEVLKRQAHLMEVREVRY